MVRTLSDKVCKICDTTFKGARSSSICHKCNLKNCKTCDKEFSNHHSNYCSVKCRTLNDTTLKGSIKTGDYLKCKGCGEFYYSAKWQQETGKKFCSRKCSDTNKRKKTINIKCANEFCNKETTKTEYEYNRSDSKIFYCGIVCSNISRSQKASRMRKFTGTKPELLFESRLKEHNIDYCLQYWVAWKKGWKKYYDFYLPNIDTLVEVDGVYWHGKDLKENELNAQQLKSRSNDLIKNKLAEENNYKLIRIWEDEITSFNMESLV